MTLPEATARAATSFVLVELSTGYACGHKAECYATVPPPAPGQSVADWWDTVVHPHTGDGHPCGSTEHSHTEAHVLASPEGRLNGRSMTWEG